MQSLKVLRSAGNAEAGRTGISDRKSSIRFADGIRIAPTHRGAILATPAGCLELKLSSPTFVSQLVPIILQGDRS